MVSDRVVKKSGRITLRIDQNTIDMLKEEAAYERRTTNNQASIILYDALIERRKARGEYEGDK